MSNFESEVGYSEKKFPDAKKALENDFEKKSFLEKHFAEFQTKEAPLRGAENKEQTRGEAFRFERGQIFKAYKILRDQILRAKERGEDAVDKEVLLDKIRVQAEISEKKLDELERQYYENGKTIEIDTEFGKFSVPVAELDLRSKEGGKTKEDERVPYFMLGSVAQNYHQMAAFAMGLALEGERVLVPTWPEQAIGGRPDNFGEILKKQNDLKIHKEYAKKTIEAMGLDKINLVGYSMGGAVSLELAQDPDFNAIQDLTIIEPAGLEDKGIVKLAKDFALEEGILKTMPYSENRIKTMNQGKREEVLNLGLLMEDCKILSKKCFDENTLGKIHPKGRYQLWVGTKSSITDSKVAKDVFLEAEKNRQENNKEANPIEIYTVNGGTHGWPLVHNIGFSKMLRNEEAPKNQINSVELSTMENSVMAGILKDIKNEEI